MKHRQQRYCWRTPATVGAAAIVASALGFPLARAVAQSATSYAPVAVKEDFQKTMARMEAAKPQVMARQASLLAERYDLGDRPAEAITMSGGKAVQEGVRVKLSSGMTWDKLAMMAAQEIRDKGLFPKGFLPLPHPNHPEGGMVFPQHHIDEIKKQEGRDLTRFDLD